MNTIKRFKSTKEKRCFFLKSSFDFEYFIENIAFMFFMTCLWVDHHLCLLAMFIGHSFVMLLLCSSILYGDYTITHITGVSFHCVTLQLRLKLLCSENSEGTWKVNKLMVDYSWTLQCYVFQDNNSYIPILRLFQNPCQTRQPFHKYPI